MSEYCITHIETRGGTVLQAHALLITIAGATNPALYSRDDIITSLDQGDTWHTGIVRKKAYGEYGRNVLEVIGDLHLVRLENNTYLRVDDRPEPSDELGALPDLSTFEVEREA